MIKRKRTVEQIIYISPKTEDALGRPRMLWRMRSLLMLLLVVVPHIGHAQISLGVYPSKPIRLIVAQAAGSTSDMIARIIGQKLTENLGQQIVVDVRPGAGGSIGTLATARAVPDGYTLLLANISTHGINPALYPKLPYDSVNDFAPVSMVAVTPFVLVVHPSVPVHSVKQLIALAKAKPAELNYASAGKGSSQHLGMELLKSLAGINMTHIPYKGGSPALLSVISGETAVMMPTLSLAMPHVKNHKINALAVTSTKRVQLLLNLPTVSETIPGYEIIAWFAMVAPVATPREIIVRLSADLARILALDDVKEKLALQGVDATSSSPEQLGAHIKSEIAKWTKVARTAGIHSE